MSIHKAIISRISVAPHPNPDVHSLAIGTVCNETIIVGNKTVDGTLGVYFPCELQLSYEFALANDLIRRKNPDTGAAAGGMFEENRRVRCQKIQGIKSNGFWTPIESLAKLGGDISKLKEGDSIDTWAGKPLCNKYITRGNSIRFANKKGRQPKGAKYEYVFPEHLDTAQFRYNVRSFKIGDDIVVTNKLHGCVHKDTILQTLERGQITIKEIVDSKSTVHVLSRDLATGEDIYSNVDDFWVKENSGEWYEVELENGVKIKITGNNPVWLDNLSCYRRVDELVVGDDAYFLQ